MLMCRPAEATPVCDVMCACVCACVCPQKQLASERIAALLEDRRIRETEEAAHRQLMNQQLEDKAAELAKAEEQLRQTTKDYILGEPHAYLALQPLRYKVHNVIMRMPSLEDSTAPAAHAHRASLQAP